jgi:hypothetical protein
VSRNQHNIKTMRLPNFIAVGPPRTGTTWLQEALIGRVGLAPVKEIQFFKWYYNRGLSWYGSHFEGFPANLNIGEICPVYFAHEPARERIARDLPSCKIVCTLRDPVERTYSHFRLAQRYGGLRSFEETLKVRPDLLEASFYARHLSEWFKLFGRDRTLVAYYDDLDSNPQRFLSSICDFLAIDRIALDQTPVGSRRINTSDFCPRSPRLALVAGALYFWCRGRGFDRLLVAWERSRFWKVCFSGGTRLGPINPETERALRELFLPDVEKLEDLLERDFSAWKPERYHGCVIDLAASAVR